MMYLYTMIIISFLTSLYYIYKYIKILKRSRRVKTPVYNPITFEKNGKVMLANPLEPIDYVYRIEKRKRNRR